MSLLCQGCHRTFYGSNRQNLNCFPTAPLHIHLSVKKLDFPSSVGKGFRYDGAYRRFPCMLVLDLEKRIVYFENAGKVNTEEALSLAKKRAQELGIKNVILASTHGYTAQKALEAFGTDLRFTVVGTDRESFSKDLLRILEDKGISVRFSHEVEYTYPELMKNALRKLSEGVKVCMDICIVAAEERLVPEGKEVIAIAGTGPLGFEDGGGADTALVMVPWKSERFNKLPEKAKRRDVKEIICKPR